MQTPKLQKIVLNTGLGRDTVLDRKRIIPALLALELITGQKANVTRAHKSVDKFKLRGKMPIGCKVTLGTSNANVFLDRLINITLPNFEDWRGVLAPRRSKCMPLRPPILFDPKPLRETNKVTQGIIPSNVSLAFGIKDFSIFREIRYDKFGVSYGLDIHLVVRQTNPKSHWRVAPPALWAFLSAFQMPIERKSYSNDNGKGNAVT